MSQLANRLINEKSPYLQQHAHNPVYWYPWGDEAFQEAKRRDKPIFLSIGYSTCHWCHVMERESFQDLETAEALNKAFVCIKVDREERPDIDAVYMRACQMLTGGGGWPLTIIMTSEKEPFFAGTYLPKTSRYGILGLKELIERVSLLWEKQRTGVITNAVSTAEVLSQIPIKTASELNPQVLENAYHQLSDVFDEVNGGFGTAPKFPSPHQLLFLLRYWRRTHEPIALEMVTKTLDAMSRGGIHDQVGGGFHRYSVDAVWLVPHFEKMLYDQATLLIAYTEAYQATGKQSYVDVAASIADYVLETLTSPEGGFYSAEDADSEGEEGTYYLWTIDEIKTVLGEHGDLAIAHFGISSEGNFREKPGANILTNTAAPDEILTRFPVKEEYYEIVTKFKKKLQEARRNRVHPLLDDKVLADWNGLMIAALAKIGRVLDNESYTFAAEKAAHFILSKMSDIMLLHRFRLGEAAIPAFLDDYAYLTWALLELYEATFKTEYLMEAKKMVKEAITLFWDSEQGGFYMSRMNADMPYSIKEIYDGAKPSGNSVMAMNLIRLDRIFGEGFGGVSEKLFKTFSSEVESAPTAYTFLLCAFDYYVNPGHEIIVAGESTEMVEIVRSIRRRYLPNTTLLLKTPTTENLPEYMANMKAIDGKPTIYLCRNRACDLPTTEIDEAIKTIDN